MGMTHGPETGHLSAPLGGPVYAGKTMQIVVTGGTGFIGRPLCASLCQEGHKVILLTRRIEVATVF